MGLYFLDSILSAASLAMDAFAVALCMGASGGKAATTNAALRLGATCGAFQFFMPLVGWFVGSHALGLISSFDHWVAFGLLAFVGGNMIRGSFNDADESPEVPDPTKSLALLYLAVATSIDALAVGASFALSARPVLPLAVGAGVITALLGFLGVHFGRYVGCKMGKRVEFAGGVVLILIGLNILREHIL